MLSTQLTTHYAFIIILHVCVCILHFMHDSVHLLFPRGVESHVSVCMSQLSRCHFCGCDVWCSWHVTCLWDLTSTLWGVLGDAWHLSHTPRPGGEILHQGQQQTTISRFYGGPLSTWR